MIAQGINPAEAGAEPGGDRGLTLELPPLGEERLRGGKKAPPNPPPARNGARERAKTRLEPAVEGCSGDTIPAPPIAVPIVTHATKSPTNGEFPLCPILPPKLVWCVVHCSSASLRPALTTHQGKWSWW